MTLLANTPIADKTYFVLFFIQPQIPSFSVFHVIPVIEERLFGELFHR